MTRSRAFVVSIAVAGLVPAWAQASEPLGGSNWTTVKYGASTRRSRWDRITS
jgi:hypothetical protein